MTRFGMLAVAYAATQTNHADSLFIREGQRLPSVIQSLGDATQPARHWARLRSDQACLSSP